MQSVAARTVSQMVPLAESKTAVALACSSSGEKPGDDESFPTSLEKVMTKPKADTLPMSNGLTKIPVSGSGSVMKNRMLRGAMNPTPEVCELFDPGGQGHAYEVSSACGSTVLHSTAKTRSCVSYATGQESKVYDPGGPL